MRKWQKTTGDDAEWLGVLGGLAVCTGMDARVLRLTYMILAVQSIGFFILLYIFLAIILSPIDKKSNDLDDQEE